ncbi:hypothetical protein RJ55_03770 [Drechmeria coniospora]|nr:hypothetical protein RJ55_03770 [Drechmeria coniospora]
MDDGNLKDSIDRHAQAADDEIRLAARHREAADQHAENAESELQQELRADSRFHNDDSHLEPSRWWFASAAFPMIAATLGPVASAFSICALGQHWRQYYPPGTNLDDAPFLPDPAWLTIINGIQLVVALLANASLLLNMTKRLRFTIAQPITIIGWYISAILLIALDATASGPLMNGLGQYASDCIWSQAFYYGIWAAILYFVTASLMVVTFYGALSGHYSKDFDLTPSQRTLMLQTVLVLMYILLGALVFSHIEGWSYLDAVYWANVTLFTVGFGDFCPVTELGRALLIPYALIGVLSLGLVISSIRSMILERGRRRFDARMEERKRRRVIRTMAKKGKDEILTPLEREPTVHDIPEGELERRRIEFELMRKIQNKASTRRKWMALIISAATWFCLWFLGALVFRAVEEPYQGWTYFNAVYFCFVSLMTIGYGDLVPVSNCGKSFFVFWSLMALPTMTVLISNAGDTVVKLVRDITITIGNITILPSEEGFTKNFQCIVYRVTFGWLFKNAMSMAHDASHLDRPDLQSRSSTFNSKKERKMGDKRTSHSNSTTSARPSRPRSTPSTNLLTPMTTQARRSLTIIRSRLDDLPTGNDFNLILISEIQAVTKHIGEAVPRRYTFEEWAWYLGLMGEDERDPETHRKAKSKTNSQRPQRSNGSSYRMPRLRNQESSHQSQGGDPTVTENRLDDQTTDDEENLKWSWVGHRNPLIGGQEESEWILERLMARLKESLWETKKEAEGSVADSM